LVGEAIDGALRTLGALPGDALVEQRYRRFRALGAYAE
jgi:hypothetical protein